MAKKTSGEKTGPYKEVRRPIRLHVTVEEYHLIRVRAAESHLSMAEFCRRVSVEQAKRGPLALADALGVSTEAFRPTEESAAKKGRGNK